MLDRRLQILVDEDRYRRIVAAAQARGVPVAVVVRDALDDALPGALEARVSAAARILAAEPMAVPSVAALRQELDDERSRRS